MSKFRTAKGSVVDMGALSIRNEKVRAVGNMRSNARGDLLDSQNKIIQDASTRTHEGYVKTVVNAPKPVLSQPPVIRNQFDLNKPNEE